MYKVELMHNPRESGPIFDRHKLFERRYNEVHTLHIIYNENYSDMLFKTKILKHLG